MARSSNESTSDLFIRLGLSYDELESGFVNAERTIRDNMSRLSRENQIISLQAQVEILGLDETADAERILEIRTKALNEQIEKQKDRVRLASAELQNMIDRTGENSDQTQKARLALERERLALAQLENQLSSLGETQEETNEGFGGLDSLLERIPPELKAVGGALLTVTTALLAAGAASKELVEKWRELQNTAYDLNMSVNDTENFLRHMKLAGGEIDDFMGYIRGITDAWTKGEWDDPEFLTLRKYGASIVDETGRLKNFQQITEEVYQAYKKAKAAGEEIEFLQLTGGESGVTDAIQYFERYEEAKEDAEKIFDAGLDPAEMHKAERVLNLLAMQMGEFKDAAVNVITPGTVEMAERLFEVFRAGTETIANNTDALRDWGGTFVEALISSSTELRAIRRAMNNLVPPESAKGLDDHTKKVLEAGENLEKAHAKLKAHLEGDPTTQYGWQRLTDLKDEIADINAEIENFNRDYDLSIAQLNLWRKRAYRQNDLSPKERQAIEEDYSTKLKQIEQQRAQDLKEIREDVLDIQRQKKDWISAGMEAAEAEELMEKLKLDAIEDLEKEFSQQYNELRQTDLENQLARIEQEKDDWIDKGIDEARATALAEEQKAKVIEEYQEKIQGILKDAASTEFELTHDAFEKQLYDIEQLKQAQLEKAKFAEEIAASVAEAAMKEAQAVEDAINKMQGKTSSLQDQLAQKTMSQRDYDRYIARKQYQQNLKDAPKALADAVYQATLNEIDKKAAEAQERVNNARRQRETAEAKGEKYNGDRSDEINQYTMSPGLGSPWLAYVDPRRIATKEVLDRLRISVDEAKKALKDSDGSQEKFHNNLQELAASRGVDANTFNSVLQIAGNGVNQFGKAAEEGANSITSATATFKQALENAARIEEINAARESALLDRDNQNRIKIVYGDDEEYQPRKGGARIMYGDEDYSANVDDYNLSPEEMIREFMGELDDSLINGLEGLFGQVEPQVTEPLDKLGESANTATTPINQLGEATGEVAAAGKEAAEKLLNAAEAMDKAREILAQSPMAQPQAQQEIDDAIQKALGGTATVGEIIAAAGAMTLQPEVAAIGAVIQALADTAAGLREAAGYNQPSQAPPPSQPQQQPAPAQDLSPAVQELKNQTTVLSEIKTALQELRQQPAADNNQLLVQSISDAAQQLSQSISEHVQSIAQAVTAGTQQFIQSVVEQTQSIMQAIADQTSQMVQALGAVSQAMAESARALTESRDSQNQRSAPNINVSPTNNINLGGAYVFDNSMKRQLTDDIAGEVASAVTSAVQSATQQANYGYGN